MASNKIIFLTSSDGETFQIEEAVAKKLQIVAHMIEDNCADVAIPLTNVTGKILARVIEYCKQHVSDVSADSTEGSGDDEAKKKTLKDWDESFMKEFDLDTKFEIILAANYLNVKGLLDLVSQAIADTIQDKKVEEVRTIFNIENDFTPEEYAAICKENAWAFE